MFIKISLSVLRNFFPLHNPFVHQMTTSGQILNTDILQLCTASNDSSSPGRRDTRVHVTRSDWMTVVCSATGRMMDLLFKLLPPTQPNTGDSEMNRHSRRRWGDHNARNRGKNYLIMGEQRWINKKRGSQLLIRLIAAAERKDNLGIHSINNLCMRLVLEGGWFTLYLMDDFTMETFIHLDLIKHCFIGRSFEWTLLLPLLLLFRLRSSTYMQLLVILIDRWYWMTGWRRWNHVQHPSTKKDLVLCIRFSETQEGELVVNWWRPAV